MRVIKEGKKPPKEIETSCPQCDCEFAYTKEDVKCRLVDEFGFAEEHYVKCPYCNMKIGVDKYPDY